MIDAARRIYLDNAATSWPKPESVYSAVEQYLRTNGAPAGRGVYREAIEVERLVERARQQVAQRIGSLDPRRIVFTQNGTDSLNLAIHGLLIHGSLRPGDHVITSVCEHNSVLRPLRTLEDQGVVEVTRVACDGRGVVSPEDFRAALRPNTRLIALVHASNVTGALQPVAAVGELAAAAGVPFLVDAAQTLGTHAVSMPALRATWLAAPGHKGLLGPLGSGVLAFAEGAESHLRPVRQGGTGTRSEDDRQPDSMPDKYESGNLNVPAIVGLAAGAAFVNERGAAITAEERTLCQKLWDGLATIRGVRLYGPPSAEERVGIVSLTMDGYDPREVAALLDSAYGIQVRAGLHCAPRMHAALGTLAQGGTVRFSIGPFTTVGEVEATITAVAEIAGANGD